MAEMVVIHYDKLIRFHCTWLLYNVS